MNDETIKQIKNILEQLKDAGVSSPKLQVAFEAGDYETAAAIVRGSIDCLYEQCIQLPHMFFHGDAVKFSPFAFEKGKVVHGEKDGQWVIYNNNGVIIAVKNYRWDEKVGS